MKENIIIELEAEAINVIDVFCEEIEKFLRKNVDGVLIKSAKVVRSNRKEDLGYSLPKRSWKTSFLSLEGTKRD